MEAGRPVLSAEQIRELMGSVPNAVFERLLEAVAAGESAKLMEELNVLLNAGHNASSLARQLARYLRNTLMAKLGGAETELLQISGDERARAARTAMLFTEEELTRNLQIVLRTFDDLNYRQEQRFHLELGLLKLIHAQRLLPLEELLSGVVSGGSLASGSRAGSLGSGGRPASQGGSGRTPSSAPDSPAPDAPRQTPAPSAPPPLSPFGPTQSSWSTGASDSKLPDSKTMSTAVKPVSTVSPVTGPVAVLDRPLSSPAPASEVSASPFSGATPFPAASTQAVTGYAAPLTEGALAKAPQAAEAATGAADVDALRQAVRAALAEAGHISAAELLASGVWTIDGSSLRIEVAGMGKKMLALTINVAAEKIIRQELQRQSGPARFLVVPGAGGGHKIGQTSGQSGAPMATPLAGSIQEVALSNPLVQQAREIFQAEVRSVVDLRQK
jgi:DNA polymerase-3 subunit gamma/tau